MIRSVKIKKVFLIAVFLFHVLVLLFLLKKRKNQEMPRMFI